MIEISSGGVVLKDKKVCLLKTIHGHWVLPKGGIEDGETKEEAALREVYEETGLIAEIQDYLGYVKYDYINKKNDNVKKTVYYYYMETNQSKIIPLRKEGFVEGSFFAIDQAIELVRHNSEKSMIKAAKRFMG